MHRLKSEERREKAVLNKMMFASSPLWRRERLGKFRVKFRVFALRLIQGLGDGLAAHVLASVWKGHHLSPRPTSQYCTTRPLSAFSVGKGQHAGSS